MIPRAKQVPLPHLVFFNQITNKIRGKNIALLWLHVRKGRKRNITSYLDEFEVGFVEKRGQILLGSTILHRVECNDMIGWILIYQSDGNMGSAATNIRVV